VAGLAALLATLMLVADQACATPPEASDWVAPDAGPSGLDAGVAPRESAVEQAKDTATVVFITMPNVTATVTWGRKLLGKILPGKPLVVVRPRDSGPLDVMVRAPGYLAVQTRAHTFSDNRVLVKLTPPDRKNELVGYRVPIDAGVEGGVAYFDSDASVPGGFDGAVVPLPAPAAPFTAPPLLPAPPVMPPAAPTP
jgi:hypothetical protein